MVAGAFLGEEVEGAVAHGDVFRGVALELAGLEAVPREAGAPGFRVERGAVEVLVERLHPVAFDGRALAEPVGRGDGDVAIRGLGEGGVDRAVAGAAPGLEVGEDEGGVLLRLVEEHLDGGDAAGVGLVAGGAVVEAEGEAKRLGVAGLHVEPLGVPGVLLGGLGAGVGGVVGAQVGADGLRTGVVHGELDAGEGRQIPAALRDREIEVGIAGGGAELDPEFAVGDGAGGVVELQTGERVRRGEVEEFPGDGRGKLAVGRGQFWQGARRGGRGGGGRSADEGREALDQQRGGAGLGRVGEELDAADLRRIEGVGGLAPAAAEEEAQDLVLARRQHDALGVPGRLAPVAGVVHAQVQAHAGLADVAQLELDAVEGGEIDGRRAEREINARVAAAGGQLDPERGRAGRGVERYGGALVGDHGGHGLGRCGPGDVGRSRERRGEREQKRKDRNKKPKAGRSVAHGGKGWDRENQAKVSPRLAPLVRMTSPYQRAESFGVRFCVA